MLNSRERWNFLELLHHICTLKLLPLDIRLKTWEIGPVVGNTLTAWTYKAAFASFLAHVSYQGVTFTHVLLFCRRTTPLYQSLIHAEFAIGSVMLAFWYYVLYIKYPSVNAALWRMTLTGDIAGGNTRAANQIFTQLAANLCNNSMFFRETSQGRYHWNKGTAVAPTSAGMLTAGFDCKVFALHGPGGCRTDLRLLHLLSQNEVPPFCCCAGAVRSLAMASNQPCRGNEVFCDVGSNRSPHVAVPCNGI